MMDNNQGALGVLEHRRPRASMKRLSFCELA
jgi:hypothetical protein